MGECAGDEMGAVRAAQWMSSIQPLFCMRHRGAVPKQMWSSMTVPRHGPGPQQQRAIYLGLPLMRASPWGVTRCPGHLQASGHPGMCVCACVRACECVEGWRMRAYGYGWVRVSSSRQRTMAPCTPLPSQDAAAMLFLALKQGPSVLCST
eukprot:scaffold124049_cov22-Tisochrysis_lutea.AAC.1